MHKKTGHVKGLSLFGWTLVRSDTLTVGTTYKSSVTHTSLNADSSTYNILRRLRVRITAGRFYVTPIRFCTCLQVLVSKAF